MTLKQRLGAWILPRLPLTRFTVELFRIEARALVVEAKNRLLPGRRRRLRTLRRSRDLRLNVACGPHVLPGFVNLDLHACHPDVVELDCRRGVPFDEGALSGIRVEHFFEHLEPREEVPAFLSSCYRALVPRGVLRIVVPDAGRFVEAYCRRDLTGFRELAVPIPFPDDLPTRMDVVNHSFHQWHEHRWGYDFETLEHRLRRSGFSLVERKGFRQSSSAELAQDREEHAPYSLYVDAVK